ncbi:DUF4132 domain-containing protein [Streptomyces sp. Qhu_M48]|uniref:DUF4132 domain-containing protein n=1 Tax=Streptomyces sp. Qhu_M48 TaxID=3435889 RepID=UPI003F50B70B
MSSTATVWRAAGDYELRLDPWAGPKPVLRCRTAAGRELKKVPSALTSEPLVRELTALAEWIGDHAGETLTSVERWMTRSLPVPAELIRQVWPDPYWRRALRYAVIAPYDGPDDESGRGAAVSPEDGADGGSGGPDVRRAGVLTGVAPGPDGGLVVRGLDGEERELDDAVVMIPHPVLLDPRGTGRIERWRKVLDPLGGEQGIEQLHRAVYVRPECSPAPGARNARQGITAFQGAEYRSGAHFENVVRRFGGRIGGERAGFGFVHQGRTYGMVADLRYQGPAARVHLHDFWFTDARGRDGAGAYHAVPRPVWSEGIRAMATLYEEREVAAGGPDGTRPSDAASGYQAFLVACAEYAAAGAPRAERPEARQPAEEWQLLGAGAVLAGEPAGRNEEVLTARRYHSPVLDDGGCFVRLVVARSVGARDAVARALGLEPDPGEAAPVGRTRVRPLDLLSRICRPHPELAPQAMALLAPLRTCAKTADTKPGRAATQLQSSLKKLTAPHPELLPYALDEGARIVAAAGSVAMARPLYTEARAAERRLGGIDEDDLRELVGEFRVLGVVDEKLLRQYRADLAGRSSAAEAYESYRRLVLDWLRRESGTPTSFVRDGVTHYRGRDVPASFAGDLAEGAGGPLPADDTHTELFHLLLRNGGLERATAALWEAWSAPLERDLAEHPDTAGYLRTHLPEPRGSSAAAKTEAAEAWLALMARVGLLERFAGGTRPSSGEPVAAGADPGAPGFGGSGFDGSGSAGSGSGGSESGGSGSGGSGSAASGSGGSAQDADAWLTLFFRRYAGLRLPVAGLEPVVASVAARMREAGEVREPLLGLESASLGGDFWGVGIDLGLFALLKRLGMPLGEPTAQRGAHVLQWIQKRGTDGVESVLADPAFEESIRTELTGAVRGSLGYAVTPHRLTPHPKVTKRVAALEPLRELMTGILDERVRRVREGGADGLFALQDLLLHVEPFLVAGAARPFDRSVREALAVDPAALLADCLRARCLAHGHEGDPVAACGLREVTVDHARELLDSTDTATRHRHAEVFTVDPARRRSRYTEFRPGSGFAEELQPGIEAALPEIVDDACRVRALGVVQGVLWCETWQETLRRFVR